MLLAGAAALLPSAAIAAPRAEAWPRWERHVPGSARTAAHDDWAGFLAAYRVVGADGIARLRYAAVAPADRARLDAYVAGLAAQPVDALDRPEQMAFWLNLYNALTVRTVLRHYPVASIRDIRISPGLFSVGPWGRKLVAVAGEEVSLDDIEHRILRPLWRDPRVHYGLNCASLGCPDLPARPFAGADVDAMLEAAARTYVNHPRGAAVEGGRLFVSSIYDWFADDFATDGGVLAHLHRHAAPALAGALAQAGRIEGDRYDWRLNDAVPA